MLHGRTGVKLRPRVLGNFYGTCVVNPKRCYDGVTFELWLHVTCSSSYQKMAVLQSNPSDSVGFSLYIDNRDLCFQARGTSPSWTSCVRGVVNIDRWLHVLVSWHPTEPYGLVVEDIATRGTFFPENLALHSKRDDLLRFIEPLICSVAINSLTIWPRALQHGEIEDRFRHGNVPRYLFNFIHDSLSTDIISKKIHTPMLIYIKTFLYIMWRNTMIFVRKVHNTDRAT